MEEKEKLDLINSNSDDVKVEQVVQNYLIEPDVFTSNSERAVASLGESNLPENELLNQSLNTSFDFGNDLKLFFESYSHKYILNQTEEKYTLINDVFHIKLLKEGTHFYDKQKEIHQNLTNKKEDCIYYISFESYVLTLYKLFTHIDKNEKNNFDEYMTILKKK